MSFRFSSPSNHLTGRFLNCPRSKNKINLFFVDWLVQIENDMKMKVK